LTKPPKADGPKLPVVASKNAIDRVGGSVTSQNKRGAKAIEYVFDSLLPGNAEVILTGVAAASNLLNLRPKYLLGRLQGQRQR